STRRNMKRNIRSVLVAVALPVALTTALAACGSSSHSSTATTGSSTGGSSSPAAPATTAAPAGPGSLIIGSADFTESALLADIYGDALQSDGVSITKKLNIGERAVYWKAMQDGSIKF